MSKGEQKKRMSAGEFYNPTDKELVLARTRARYIADKFNRSRAWNLPYRTHLIKKLFPTERTARSSSRQSERNTGSM